MTVQRTMQNKVIFKKTQKLFIYLSIHLFTVGVSELRQLSFKVDFSSKIFQKQQSKHPLPSSIVKILKERHHIMCDGQCESQPPTTIWNKLLLRPQLPFDCLIDLYSVNRKCRLQYGPWIMSYRLNDCHLGFPLFPKELPSLSWSELLRF